MKGKLWCYDIFLIFDFNLVINNHFKGLYIVYDHLRSHASWYTAKHLEMREGVWGFQVLCSKPFSD